MKLQGEIIEAYETWVSYLQKHAAWLRSNPGEVDTFISALDDTTPMLNLYNVNWTGKKIEQNKELLKLLQ